MGEMLQTDNRRLTKNEKRRLREKKEKENEINNPTIEKAKINHNDDDEDENIIIEYISPNLISDTSNAIIMNEFKEIFDKFTKPEELTNDAPKIDTKNLDIVDNNKEQEEEVVDKISKKKKKLSSRLSVAELKQLVLRPDVVEAHDVTANDPRLLVSLKAYRNSVPVPRHWCSKRRYLQGKRGIEKPAFQLPEFIAETGIAKIRDTVIEQEALKKSKQKARDKMTPKMGKIDIDYQVLHDAFFKYQTKPKLTIHGDIYYESKEYEVYFLFCVNDLIELILLFVRFK